MTNEIQKVNSQFTNAPSIMPSKAVCIQGERPVYAENVGVINVKIESASIDPQSLTPVSPPSPIEFDRGFYNLFVSYDVDIKSSQPFVVDCDRALTAYMDDGLKATFSSLSNDTIIERIKRFPCLFANENTAYGHTDEEQELGFGYVRQIKVRREGIKIYPQVMYLMKQQRINEAMFDLDIYGSSTFNELNRMHWSIKKVDLIAELREIGYQI